MRGYPRRRRRLDEAFVKMNGQLSYLWRAVESRERGFGIGSRCEVHDTVPVLKLLKPVMKTYGRPRNVGAHKRR